MTIQGRRTGIVRPYSIEEYLTRVYSWNTTENQRQALMDRALTAALVPIERYRGPRLVAQGRPVKLHLGCGGTYLRGWINIDTTLPRGRRDLRWDLRRGLPLPDGVVESIFAEHLLEHLDLRDGLRLLKECHRVLTAGGVLRIGVPDFERYVHAYTDADSIIDEVRPRRSSRALAIAEIFFFHGHRSAYDYETLALLLREAGFDTVEHSKSGEGRLNPPVDSEARQPETLYVEAVK
jgi:predicted SAM-dependent methyltransferase